MAHLTTWYGHKNQSRLNKADFLLAWHLCNNNLRVTTDSLESSATSISLWETLLMTNLIMCLIHACMYTQTHTYTSVMLLVIRIGNKTSQSVPTLPFFPSFEGQRSEQRKTELGSGGSLPSSPGKWSLCLTIVLPPVWSMVHGRVCRAKQTHIHLRRHCDTDAIAQWDETKGLQRTHPWYHHSTRLQGSGRPLSTLGLQWWGKDCEDFWRITEDLSRPGKP